MGLANDKSIAWGIAQALNAHGAQLAISYQNEQIKQLKTGIKSINQALPSSIRKDVFGNYFSNSLSYNSDSSEDMQSLDDKQSNYNIGGALNPDKVYPKITFSEFRKLYNKL